MALMIIKKWKEVNKNFVEELNKRPELSSVFLSTVLVFPQYMMKIDNDLAQQKRRNH